MSKANLIIEGIDSLTEKKVMNVANVSLKDARSYAEKEFAAGGKDLDKLIPNFDENYKALQKKMTKAINTPRIDMPVIEPEDMDRFENDIRKGRIDIFKPAGDGHSVQFPDNLLVDKKRAKNFLTLGLKDGDPNDDRLKAKVERIPANKLIPVQNQIWLEKLVGNMVQFGIPDKNSPIAEATIIVSREGYILDGHHRFGQAMLGNPSMGLRAIRVPLDIDLLLRLGRSYGNAIGNKQKA